MTATTSIRNAAAAATWLGMVATPLNRRGGGARRVLSNLVVGGLATTTTAAVARRLGWSRAAGGVTAVAGLTTVVERLGTVTGVPFGAYHYTEALRPKVGGVPAIVPLAWWAMAVPARESARAALGAGETRCRRIVLGAAALTAWDLFLDPQMTAEGYWRWASAGRYRGIPATNYLGWFLTSIAVMGVLEVAVPVDDEPPADDLVVTYAAMTAMETVGFAAFFRDRLVAVVGGVAMLPIAYAALAGNLRSRRA